MHTGLGTVSLASLGSFFVVAALSPVSIAQDVCAQLDEFQCALVARSMNTWNELWGENLRIREWTYEMTLNADNLSIAVGAITDPKQMYLPVQDTDTNNIIGVTSLAGMEQDGELSVGDMYELLDEWTKDAWAFADIADHLISIDWASKSANDFKTFALVGDAYPYIYDTMLFNAAIIEKSNTCEHFQVKWLWGGVRGEMIVDITPLWQDDLKRCKRLMVGYMQLGYFESKMGNIFTRENYCEFEYAYVFTTPLLKAKFNRNGFGFELSGMGSYWKGKGDCVDSSGE